MRLQQLLNYSATVYFINELTYLSAYLFMYLSTNLFVSLFIHAFIFLPVSYLRDSVSTLQLM
jgi:hypothetical protein